ncbi:6822_t:CDS:2 [Scutellospora calospora]|uniref:6822_t:CDS:1 n=1 Tax=Scutellospora calospora TaxID=85575 RepID=A0ACA9KLU2_9GLOM|nr:6822_t:CDS:2 [Scutellospora calospora]
MSQLRSDILSKKKYAEIEKAELQYKRTYTVTFVQPYDDDNRMQKLLDSLSSTSNNEMHLSTEPKETIETDEDIVNDTEDYYNEVSEFKSEIVEQVTHLAEDPLAK